MATTTKATPCPKDAWTELADGASVATVGINGDGNLALVVAASAPSLDTDDYVFAPKVGVPPLILTLGAGAILYGRPFGGAQATARFYQT